jgi:hypothetical protein
MGDPFNWVKARSECSLTHVFDMLNETVKEDVKAAREFVDEAVVSIHRVSEEKTIVSRVDTRSVTFELLGNEIVVTRKKATQGGQGSSLRNYSARGLT